jgi:hypothetical protein
MDAMPRRLFLAAGLAGVPGALVAQQFNTPRRNPDTADHVQFLTALGREMGAQVRAARAGGSPREIARSFTTTLRLHAAYLRQHGGDDALRDSIRDAKRSGHWQHALDRAGDPAERARAAAECRRRFGVDLSELSPAPSKPATAEDFERFAELLHDGLSISSEIDKLADALDAAADRLPGVQRAAWEQSYEQWCQSTICYVIWLLEIAWGAACSLGWLAGEPGLIACAVAFIEYEQARFFAWLIGCYC